MQNAGNPKNEMSSKHCKDKIKGTNSTYSNGLTRLENMYAKLLAEVTESRNNKTPAENGGVSYSVKENLYSSQKSFDESLGNHTWIKTVEDLKS